MNKRICGLLLALVILFSVCDFSNVHVEAVRVSDITLNGVTLSRTPQTEVCKKKLDSGDIIDYEFTYYNYQANLNNPSIVGATDYFSNMNLTHPRLLINDFSLLLEKIDTDYICALNYKGLKAEADGILKKEPYSFYLNQRDNINNFSSNIESRAIVLSFIYNIEREKAEAGRADAISDYDKYAVRAVQELLAAAEYPHWSVNAFLCTAEVADGFAFGYDWLYDYLCKPENAAAKQTIENAVYNQCIVPYLYNYIVDKTGTDFAYTGSNWNPVCNSSAIIIGMAFYNAADTTGKYSTICQYLTERGAEALWNGMGQYADGGFYREGSSYWTYATQYLTRAVAAYEYAAKPGYTMPERYTHILAPGVSVTPDFPIYMNGIASTFDFGDCSSALQLDSSMLWIGNRFNKPSYGSYYNTMKLLYNKEYTGKGAVYTILWNEPQNSSFDVLQQLPKDMAHVSENDVNILSMRSDFEVNASNAESAFVAVQGGQNLANHMGSHLGTFVLDMNGKRFVKQMVNGNYAWPGYNGTNTKYKYYVRRAEGNNTLIVDPQDATDKMEQANDAFGKIIKSASSDTTAYGILDLTSTNEKFEKWYRGVMLTDNRRRVIVQDEIKATLTANNKGRFNDVYWFAHIGDAACEISSDGKTATLTVGGVSIKAKILRGPGKFEVVDAKPLPTSPNPTEQQSKLSDYGKKLQIHMTEIGSLTNVVEFCAADVTDSLPYIAMSNWDSRLSDYSDADEGKYTTQGNYETDWYDASYKTFYIHDDKDLAGLAYLVNSGTSFEGKKIKLVNDIDLDSTLTWVPIGSLEKPFKGTFDGSQKMISGAKYDNFLMNCVGLFGVTENAKIMNVALGDFSFTAKTNVGALVGVAKNTEIINVFADNSILRAKMRLGGLVGVQYGGKILNSGINAKVFGSISTYGGIAGYAAGTVDNCSANVQFCESVNSSGQGVLVGGNVGGIVGISACGDVKNSYYNYIVKYIGSGTQPMSRDASINLSNSVGKFDTALGVSNIGSSNTVLGYLSDGKRLDKVNNCWISAQTDKANYVTWTTASGDIGQYAKLAFVPETVEDENDNKDLYEIGKLTVSGTTLSVPVTNLKKSGTNTGYLVVVQNTSDGAQSIKIYVINIAAGATQTYQVEALEGARIQAFALESFITMKIKSNCIMQ